MKGIHDNGLLLLVDKPRQWTSFDVVKKLKKELKIKKMGHAGTLDPLATGLLLIATGKKTKELHAIQELDKSYQGIIEIGKTTPSFDLETPFDSESDWSYITDAAIQSARSNLLGEIIQVPPKYSAVKINGERAYKKARRNENVNIKSRRVQIFKFNITVSLPQVHFEVVCSKGTYIRSLANDFGTILGTGAFLKELRRTAIGQYTIMQSQTIDEVIQEFQ